jgi:GntR family transcriptional regulator
LGTFVIRSLAKPGMVENSALRAELSRWVRDAVAAGLERTDIEALVDMELEREFIESDLFEIEGETS